ncbi:MAG: DUF424 domain-containing protein [Thermoplasmatota archaeon]
MFAVRNYQQGLQRLLAACDEELLGTSHAEGKFRLEVNEDFYDGMRVERPELEVFLAQCTVANLVGERTVQVAIEAGVIAADNVLDIDGVAHAQLVVI